MTRESFFRYTWPWKDHPTVYYDARAERDVEQGSVHAKCVVVDEAGTFIWANFTRAAQGTNIELGVVIHDHDFATRTAAQWRTRPARGLFVSLGGH